MNVMVRSAAAAAGLALLVQAALAAQDQKASKAARDQQPAASQSSEAAILQYRAAVAFHNKAEWDFAVEEWERFLTKFPDDPLAAKAQHYAGIAYLQLKKPEQAIAAFNKVIEKHPKFEMLDANYLNLGMSYYAAAQAGQAEMHDRAAAAFDTLAKQFPGSPQAAQALYYRGESQYARGKKDDAVASYRELIEKHPK